MAHPLGFNTPFPCLPQHKYVHVGPPVEFPVPPPPGTTTPPPPIAITGGIHHSFSACFNLPTSSSPETHTFDSRVTLDIANLGRITLPAQTQVQIRNTSTPSTPPGTMVFETEILALDLVGMSPIQLMLRESPTQASQGGASITDLGGGLYHIDSFFDVFTELSLDDGASWIPGSSPFRVHLVPAPGALALFGLGLGMMLGLRRKAG